MIYTEKEIRDLLSKDFKQVRQTSSGNIYNRKSLDWIKSFGTITSNIKDFKSFVPQIVISMSRE